MRELPAGWRSCALGEVAEVIRGVTYQKAEARAEPQDGYLPLLRATNIDRRLLLDAELVFVPEARVKQQQRLRRGDVVLAASSGSASVVGKSALLPTAWVGTFGAFCAVLRAGSQVLPEYLALFVSSPSVRQQWSDAARGTNINNLKSGDVSATRVPLPDLGEQRRIVDLLEAHMSRLDAADSLVRASADRLIRLRLANLRRWRGESSDASHEGARSLQEVAETALGKMLDAKKSSGESTPYLRNINVRWGRIDCSDVAEVPLSDQERSKFSLRQGDLLVCEGGEPGRAAIWDSDQPMTFQKALHRVRVRPGADVQGPFLQLMIEEFVRNGRAADMFTGTTIRHLPQEKLRQIRLPVPPASVQARVLAEAQEADSASARLKDEFLQVAGRSKVLRRTLLGAAFSGQLAHAAPGLEGAHV